MLACVCIWLRTHNWSRTVRRAAITYSFMLNGALGTDLIGIVKVLSPKAMIGYCILFGHSTYCMTM